MSGIKILIMGLPGAGKTTLATEIASELGAVWWNADEVREKLGNPGFSVEARVIQAARMGFLCDVAVRAGHSAIADFVCPLPETRNAFDPDDQAKIIWVDRIEAGRFEDTNRMFVPPERFDFRVIDDGRPAASWAKDIVNFLRCTS
jgi:nucleoside-triphosphatase THEP1